jgi:hypothetical protein
MIEIPKYNNNQIVLMIVISSIFSLVNSSAAYRTLELNGVERRDVIREDTLRQRAKFGDYEIKIYRDWDIGTFGVVQIFQKGELVFEEQAHKFYLRDDDDDDATDDWTEVGKDFTGDGEPNLVVREWSGGAHCCYDSYLFSIGEEFRFIDKFEGEHSPGGFEDIDGDGSYEFLINDWTFAYWNASFSISPAPVVVLSYRDGRYQPAYDLMSKPLSEIMSHKDILERDKEFWDDKCYEVVGGWSLNDACIKYDVWEHMLGLIYGGHPNEAWSFIDRYWKWDEATKKAFLDDFKSQLALSDYAGWLPVNLREYRPDIDDEPNKKYIRFQTYYDAVMGSMKSIKKDLNTNSKVPTLHSVNDETIQKAIRNWSGQK